MAAVVRFWRYSLCVAFALLGGVSAYSQTNTLPFECAEGLLWVKVNAPQSERPLNFLFDTGAEVSVLNASTASALGLTGGEPIHVQGVDSATVGHWPVKLAATAGTMAVPERYLSLDMSTLAKSCQRPLDGLLGADFLKGKVVQIDFAAHEIRFLDRVDKQSTAVSVPLKVSGGCFCVAAHINGGRKQWLRLDTGCLTPLQWVTTDSSLPVKSLRPAIGLTGMAIPQTETSVRLGNMEIPAVPTGIHRQAIFAGESGLLGLGLVSRFETVTIDTRNHRLLLDSRSLGVSASGLASR